MPNYPTTVPTGVIVNATGSDQSLPDVPRTNQVWIEKRESWSDDWEADYELLPLDCEIVVGSSGPGKLQFARQYGPRVRETWESDEQSRDKLPDLAGWWIRLRQSIDAEDVTLFVGQVAAPTEDVQGDQTTNADSELKPQGVQRWTAYGPLKYFERFTFSRSTWQYLDTHETYELDWVPNVNMRHGDPNLVGNRSTQAAAGISDPVAVFTFGGSSLWTAADFLQYALRFYVMDAVTDGPVCDITGAKIFLDTYTPRVTMSEISDMGDLLRQLITRSRGMDFIPEYWEDTVSGADGFDIFVFGLSDEEVVFAAPDGTIFKSPVNHALVPLNVSEEIALQWVVVERGHVQAYQTLRVVGDRCLTVFSIGNVAGTVGPLVGGWTAAQEAAYKAGDVVSTDPVDSDHDSYRNDRRFDDVFSYFGLDPNTFDYAGGAANPLFAADGTYSLDADHLQVAELGVLPQLPLEAGVNYTTDPPSDRRPVGSRAEYLPVMAWIWDPRLERYLEVNKLQAVNGSYPAMQVTALEHELGVRIRCAPNHALAFADWGGAAPSKFDPEAAGFDWRDLVITLAVETDNRISLEVEAPPWMAIEDGSVKELVVPLAQFWWLTGTTAVETSGAGTLLGAPAGGVAIRNDINLLAAMLPGLIARYLRPRNRATIVRRGTIEAVPYLVGELLDLEGEQSEMVETPVPVTAVRWEFTGRSAQTTIMAGHRAR